MTAKNLFYHIIQNKYLGTFLLFFGIFFNYFIIYLLISIILINKYIKKKKLIFLIFFYVIIAISIFDFWEFKIKKRETIYNIQSNISYSINPDYGYHPQINKIFSESIFKNNKKIDQITYSINEFGHRITGENNKKSKTCIFFHGGSYTFGQMLNDVNSLPYQLNKQLKFTKNVYNLGFNGYGPHQFLRKIEIKHLENYQKCEESYIIYIFIPDHIGRVTGKRSWGDKSPRYILKNQKIIFKGFFSNYPFKIKMKLRKNFRNSKFFRTFIYDPNSINKTDNKIFINILKEIEEKSKKIWKKTQYVYILWDFDKINDKEIIDFFENKKIVNINNLNLKGIPVTNEYDSHPSSEINKIISSTIIKKLNWLNN